MNTPVTQQLTSRQVFRILCLHLIRPPVRKTVDTRGHGFVVKVTTHPWTWWYVLQVILLWDTDMEIHFECNFAAYTQYTDYTYMLNLHTIKHQFIVFNRTNCKTSIGRLVRGVWSKLPFLKKLTRLVITTIDLCNLLLISPISGKRIATALGFNFPFW